MSTLEAVPQQPGLEVSHSTVPKQVYSYNGDYTPVAAMPGGYQGGYLPPLPAGSTSANDAPKNREKARTVFRLRPSSFLLSLALGFVILAAGIGGGVGGTLAVKNARREASKEVRLSTITETVTPTTCATVAGAFYTSTIDSASPTTETSRTSSSNFSAPTPKNVALDCPNLTNQIQRIILKGNVYNFAITCGEDFNAVRDKSVDIVAITVYSLKDCAQACASYNRNNNDTLCKAAVFSSTFEYSVRQNLGSCWLKNSTGNEASNKGNTLAGLLLLPNT
ncbi:hypothetical protein BJ875DRAFT_487239 [Amylocarpus encephaloides]|uniref:Apple domain-containing protein n=1 Tax=Amylocarpus encephaloides TaxID=45428 RepID=A0A9P8C2P4_9HELO|nr:hypothetical protein BJ875DRAFT_487239 [Amylocarpus encephaloides]